MASAQGISKEKCGLAHLPSDFRLLQHRRRVTTKSEIDGIITLFGRVKSTLLIGNNARGHST